MKVSVGILLLLTLSISGCSHYVCDDWQWVKTHEYNDPQTHDVHYEKQCIKGHNEPGIS